MRKVVLDRFISKYHLGGAVDIAQWVSDGSTLSVACCDETNTLYAFVTTSDITLPKGKFNIFETKQLRALLAVLGDEIKFNVRQTGGIALSFQLSDDAAKVSYALADASVIPTIPLIKNLPNPEVSLNLNKTFTDAFLRARSALATAELFTVKSKGSVTEVVLGYEESNATQVTITPEVNTADDMNAVSFRSELLRDILTANKDATSGTMTVSEKGIMHISFVVESFSRIDYYLLQQKK